MSLVGFRALNRPQQQANLHQQATPNPPSSRRFRACQRCRGRGVGPARELRQWWPFGANEWEPVPCATCAGRGWVRA